MTTSGQPFGVTAIVEGVSAMMSTSVVRFGVRAQGVRHELFLLSPEFWDFHAELYHCRAARQTTRPRVTLTSFENFGCAVPSPAEQQRIVGILDEAFDGIATAKANAEKNLQNARALFESHLQLSSPSEEMGGWKDVEEEATKIKVGATPSDGLFSPGDRGNIADIAVGTVVRPMIGLDEISIHDEVHRSG